VTVFHVMTSLPFAEVKEYESILINTSLLADMISEIYRVQGTVPE
jgi:hypothetical protein